MNDNLKKMLIGGAAGIFVVFIIAVVGWRSASTARSDLAKLEADTTEKRSAGLKASADARDEVKKDIEKRLDDLEHKVDKLLRDVASLQVVKDDASKHADKLHALAEKKIENEIKLLADKIKTNDEALQQKLAEEKKAVKEARTEERKWLMDHVKNAVKYGTTE